MKLKVKPGKYCNEHAIETSRCPDINPMEPVRMLCTKCNFQIYGATEKEAIERWNEEYDLAHKPKGVMIVGFKMPNRCVVRPLLRKNTIMGDYCFMENRRGLCHTHIFNQRPSWCPLQEVK